MPNTIAFKPLNDIFSKPPYNNKEIYFLFKILIHEKCREGMLDELDSLGINRHTLFPDLDGLAKYIAWKNQRMGRLKRLSQDIMLKL